MKTLILETEYSIFLAPNYISDKLILSDDWLCICLYYEQITGIIKANDNFNQELIKFFDYPFTEFIKYNYLDGRPYNTENITLNAIRYANENGFDFLPNLDRIDRENFIFSVNKHLPEAISTLKKSFLSFDLIRYFVVNNIPTVGGCISKELENKLIEFKKNDFGRAFNEGISNTIEKYSTYYYVTPALEQLLKNEFISIQQEFLGKLDFEKIKSFKFSSLIEDSVGTAVGLVIPFLPLGTLIELFNYIKTQIEFKQNTRLQFILSIYYLQKILQKGLESNPSCTHCVICQTTSAEIANMNDDEVDEFIFKNTLTMCMKHLTGYLTARKFGQLTGKALLFALKTQD
ncbi:MAG: hypothetical protein FWH59_02190 [Lentimicrobiaceae bacterium]|nr:hypothetical protein [Lentimicrobiaceae bacterium]